MQSPAVDSPPSPIRRESLTEQTARAIRESILNGTYKPGEKLREADFVNLGVSSSVIREALHVLQGEGIVVAKPYCGRTVFDLAPDQVSELIVMRASLESYAAYLAAQKMTKKAANAILSAASRFIDEPPESYSDWVDRELTFHRTVWEASGNEWLMRQLLQFSLPTFAARIVGRGDTDVHHLWQQCRVRENGRNPQGHQKLAKTLAHGSPLEAKQLMVLHILPEPSQVRTDMLLSGKELG